MKQIRTFLPLSWELMERRQIYVIINLAEIQN